MIPQVKKCHYSAHSSRQVAYCTLIVRVKQAARPHCRPNDLFWHFCAYLLRN